MKSYKCVVIDRTLQGSKLEGNAKQRHIMSKGSLSDEILYTLLLYTPILNRTGELVIHNKWKLIINAGDGPLVVGGGQDRTSCQLIKALDCGSAVNPIRTPLLDLLLFYQLQSDKLNRVENVL